MSGKEGNPFLLFHIDQELKDAVKCILMHVHFYWAVCHQQHGQ